MLGLLLLQFTVMIDTINTLIAMITTITITSATIIARIASLAFTTILTLRYDLKGFRLWLHGSLLALFEVMRAYGWLSKLGSLFGSFL